MSRPKFSDQHLDIADHKTAWHWMTKTARFDAEGFVRLTGENVTRLHVLFGEPQWKSKGDQEWTHGWLLAMFGLNFVVTSGPTSTMYYVRVPTDGEDYLSDPRVGVGIVEFLSYMLKQLRAPH